MSTALLDELRPVIVRILDKEYQVACRDEERETLLNSAQYLDRKMKEIRDSRKVIGTDRIAVMAALNIANDLLQCQSQGGNGDGVNLKGLQDKVEMALNRVRQMEL
jgi:cell division protein ZapA